LLPVFILFYALLLTFPLLYIITKSSNGDGAYHSALDD
jgi:hypothetical protein